MLVSALVLIFIGEMVHIYVTEWGYINEIQSFYQREIKEIIQQNEPQMQNTEKLMIK